MATRLQELIEATQELSPLEKLDLINALSRSLHQTYAAADFWTPRSLEEHVRQQGTAPVTDLAALRANYWPEDESADDFIAYIYDQRAGDRYKR